MINQDMISKMVEKIVTSNRMILCAINKKIMSHKKRKNTETIPSA